MRFPSGIALTELIKTTKNTGDGDIEKVKSATMKYLKALMVLYLSVYNPNHALTLSAPLLKDSARENFLFLHDRGLFVEPSSFAYSYSTFVYERVYLMVPNNYEIGYHLDTCGPDENQRTGAEVAQLILSLQDTLADRIAEYKSPVLTETDRPKRELILLSLLVAAAIMSVGVSLYNSYQLTKLSEETNVAMQEISRLSEAARSTPTYMNRVIDQMNNISVVIPELGNKINTLIATVNCEQTRSAFFRNLDRQLHNDVILRVTSGVNALYSGKITPDFYPISLARKTLLSRDDMHNSLYGDDISLVYKLGNFVTLSVDHHPFSIAGVLILPKLLRENIGMILMLSKVPIMIHETSELAILDEPDIGILDTTASVVWTPDMSLCIKHTGTYFCPLYDVKSKFSKCITSIMFKNSTMSCKFKPVHGEPHIKQANSGLLLGATIKEFGVMTKDRDGNNKVTTKQVMHLNHSNLVTVSDGSEILIKDEIFMLAPEAADLIIGMSMNVSYNSTPISMIDIDAYTKLDHMPPFDPQYIHYYSAGLSGFNIMALILLAIAAVIIYKHHGIINHMTYQIQQLERVPLYKS